MKTKFISKESIMLAEKHRNNPRKNRYKKEVLIKQELEKIKAKEKAECTFQPKVENPNRSMSPACNRLYDEARKRKEHKKLSITT